jgi:diguanylate cyclase (GGDEF)-like protein/PAS domain S-box-containing protein
MKLKFRLTPTLVALVSAVLMICYTGYELARERAETIARAELQTQNFARVLEEHARQTLHRVGVNLSQADVTLAPLRHSSKPDAIQARLLLNQLLPADRLIQNAMLLDDRGALVLSTQAEPGAGYGASAQSDYFAPHVRGADRELVFGSPLKAADGQWLLPVSRRLDTAGGAFDGVLVAMVRATYFQDFYDSIERGPEGLVTLFLSSGAAVIMSPANHANLGANWSQSPLFRRHLPAWPTGTVHHADDRHGVERIFSYRALNDYPVVVTYGLAMATVLDGWQLSAWYHAMLLVTALALLAGAAVFLRGQESLRRAADNELKNSELNLTLTSKNMNTLVEAIPDAIFFKDGDGRWLITNEVAKQLFQLHSIAWEGRSELELAALHPDFRAAHEACLVDDEKAWQGSGMSLFKETILDEGGRSRHFEVRKIPVFDESGGRQSLVIIGRDVTEQKNTEEALRIAATAFESQQGMAITNEQREILRVNKAFTAITGYSDEEAVGQTPRFLSSGRHDSAFYAAMTQSLETSGAWQGEIWNRRKDGEIYPEWLTISAVKDHAALTTHYVAIFNDISERVKAQAQIDTLAFYDPLTQLPNRRLLLDRLDQALHVSTRHARKSALLFVDLDNFKTLNDTLGHFQGDTLLVQVAQRLKTCIREGDTIARLGSDEFVVMLEDLSEDDIEAATQAETVGEKILNAFVPDFTLESGVHHSTPSIGVTLYGGAALEGSEQPLKRAELAMFQAKAAGRNTLRFFDARMQADVSAHAALEADLREAVVKQQFLLHYQPQVVGTGHIIGVEALVRWQHPSRGIVSPAQFIPLAEESGLIFPIGQWVLETACAQLAAWSTQPKLACLTIAVNVSARQFKQSDFVDSVLATLARTGATPKLLKLELTESMLVDDVEAIIAKMGALKAHGIGFSLDDFGTGYSSLAYLKRLPLDQLKIDQGFIRNIVTDSNDSAIAKMVIVLAESLGLSVIAEGVELQAQADFLAHMGCHAYQGYLFSKPVPLDAFESLM